MTDICKCKGKDGAIICPYKDKCFRYTAEANELYQTYFVGIPLIDNNCNYYLSNNAESILNQENYNQS